MVSGLGESTKGEWSGDVDLNDGSAQQLYSSYKKQIEFISGISMEKDDRSLKQNIELLMQQVIEDVNFVSTSEFT